MPADLRSGASRRSTSDPQNSTRMEVDFAVEPSVPVKTDSIAEITSVSPLGDNFLGIGPGTLDCAAGARRARS